MNVGPSVVNTKAIHSNLSFTEWGSNTKNTLQSNLKQFQRLSYRPLTPWAQWRTTTFDLYWRL